MVFGKLRTEFRFWNGCPTRYLLRKNEVFHSSFCTNQIYLSIPYDSYSKTKFVNRVKDNNITYCQLFIYHDCFIFLLFHSSFFISSPMLIYLHKGKALMSYKIQKFFLESATCPCHLSSHTVYVHTRAHT